MATYVCENMNFYLLKRKCHPTRFWITRERYITNGGPYAALTSGCSANSFIRGECSDSKRKRSWSRAVFSSLQRKGLEKRFDVQKYVTKPDRRQLAGLLGLTDAQVIVMVKVWFQNRRMKWRHTEDAKRGTSGTELNSSSSSCVQRNALNAESPLHRSVDSDDSDLSPGQPSSPPLIPNPATVPLEESKLVLASDLYSIRKF